jgi:hypothetical protein
MNAKEVKAALADEGVQAAIAKQVNAAVKAETKRVLEAVREVADENKNQEDKVAKHIAAGVLKTVVAGIKAP